MNALLHILGLCGDSHSHMNLLDLLFYGTGISVLGVYAKSSCIVIKNKINGIIRRKS